MNYRWLILVPFVGLALLFSKALYLDKDTLPSALLGKPLPQFELAELHSGEILTADKIKGEPALLNVWATWCPSCRVEHPMFNKLASQGVKIIGINYKDTASKAVKWLEDLGNPYVLNLYDNQGRLGLDLGVYGAPETYLMAADGTILHKHVGVVDERVWAGELGNLYRELISQGGEG